MKKKPPIAMHLDKEFFGQILSGEKTLEARVKDRKRRNIKSGDIIEFISRSDGRKKVRVVVTRVQYFDNFEDMASENNPKQMGSKNRGEFLNKIRGIYSAEEEKKYGAIAIFFDKERGIT